MQLYITLYKYTGPSQSGGLDRFEKIKQIITDEKGRFIHIYGLLGAYDSISVSEFPDNQSAMRSALRIGNLIGAQTNTMAAVEGEDFLKIMGEL